MDRKNIFLIVMGVVIVFAIMVTNRDLKKPYEHIGYALDTQIRIVVYDKDVDKNIAYNAFTKITEKEKILSNFLENSETSKLNKDKEIVPAEDLMNVLKKGYEISEKSNGSYDITIYPLTSMWHYKNEYVPGSEEIENAKKKINYKNLIFDEKKIRLINDASVDVSSVAKGYIADEIIKYLKENNVKNALVDAGGNIKVTGSPSKKENVGFMIGIQDPHSNIGIPFAQIEIKDKSIVTSGIYERKFEKNGKTYHHIIDPKTGYPTDNDIVAVSVIGENSIDCDAYATAVMVLGTDDGMKLIKSKEDLKCIIIKKNKKVILSENIKEFQINNEEYTVEKIY